jgi:hypothetical protein
MKLIEECVISSAPCLGEKGEGGNLDADKPLPKRRGRKHDNVIEND